MGRKSRKRYHIFWYNHSLLTAARPKVDKLRCDAIMCYREEDDGSVSSMYAHGKSPNHGVGVDYLFATFKRYAHIYENCNKQEAIEALRSSNSPAHTSVADEAD